MFRLLAGVESPVYIYQATAFAVGMPVCPECSVNEPAVDKWLQSAEDATLEVGSVLVVCPACDVVLGGGRYVAN